ncbi:Vacuolar-processing enzyme [Linum perenne]
MANLQLITAAVTTFLILMISPSLQLSSRKLPKDGPPPSPSRNNTTPATKWAILVAGSNTMANYRHQSDVCHAYHVLKRGGLKDDNIVVFMYDDVAFSLDNPRPGILINNPTADDFYSGVPKDYTGENCTAQNLYAVILGNRSALTGGSGKVVNSGPNDTVFIYYADHGTSGFVGMPVGGAVYAHVLGDVLKKKHDANGYKSMVIYLEACDAGSMFDGMLPNDTNIYAMTASNPSENSYAFYCPDDDPSPPPDYNTCLGDLFSISWLEDSDLHDPRKETLDQQYRLVRRRTAMDYDVQENQSSHVMQYGDITIAQQNLSDYIGYNDSKVAETTTIDSSNKFVNHPDNYTTMNRPILVSQRDILLFHLQQQEKVEAEEKLNKEVSSRKRADETISRIVAIVFAGYQNADDPQSVINFVRPSGQPLVDDWDCFKSFVEKYEEECGEMSVYGKKYSRALANMCNAGVTLEQLNSACNQVCPKRAS